MTVNDLITKLTAIAATSGDATVFVGPFDDPDALSRMSDLAYADEFEHLTFDDVETFADGVRLASINF